MPCSKILWDLILILLILAQATNANYKLISAKIITKLYCKYLHFEEQSTQGDSGFNCTSLIFNHRYNSILIGDVIKPKKRNHFKRIFELTLSGKDNLFYAAHPGITCYIRRNLEVDSLRIDGLNLNHMKSSPRKCVVWHSNKIRKLKLTMMSIKRVYFGSPQALYHNYVYSNPSWHSCVIISMQLSHLDLSQNYINDISLISYYKLNLNMQLKRFKLEFMNASHNDINVVPAQILKYMTRLKVLDLSYNPLITRDMVYTYNLLPSMKEIYLHDFGIMAYYQCNSNAHLEKFKLNYFNISHDGMRLVPILIKKYMTRLFILEVESH
ncbi:unnamed protein product [Gordionus sp. m RMFG-2023]